MGRRVRAELLRAPHHTGSGGPAVGGGLAAAAIFTAMVLLLVGCQVTSLLTEVKQRVAGANTVGAVATPTFSPKAGPYTSDQQVTIRDTTSGAKIHYTTDGSTPSASSLTYSNPIPVAGDGTSETIRAIAMLTGMKDSAVASAAYTISYPPPTYTVTYDANGATGGSAPADSNNYQQGATVTTLGNTGSLVKSGYTFIGWNTAADGSGTSYPVGASFVMGTSDVTLYANWTAQPTYTLTYDANGADGGSVPADSNNYLQGVTVTVRANTGSLVKSGYTFAGWNTAADGSGTNYSGGTTFTMGTSNVTLYANWTAQPTYTVAYDANGADGGSAPADSNNYLQGATVTVRANTGSLVKSGYTFTRWNTAADGSGTNYSGGTTFTMGTSNITLYAVWTLQSYSVTLMVNHSAYGSITTPSTNTVTVNYGVPTDVVAAPSTGYHFVNWTQTGGTGSVSFGNASSASTTVTLTGGDATIQANFAADQYSLTLTVNNSAYGGITTPSTSPVTVDYGGATSITASPSPGYLFQNWTVASGSGVTFGNALSASTTVTLTSGNVTIQANFAGPIIETVAGDGTAGFSGDGASATAAELNYPFGIAFDSSGVLYIADKGNSRIRKVDSSGVITSMATVVNTPFDVAVDSSGNVYVAEPFTNTVVKLASSGSVSTFAGTGTAGYSGDGGAATSAMLNSPNGVAVDSSGNVYIADTSNNCIRMVDGSGKITTVAGNATAGSGFSGDGGQATKAQLYYPADIATDSSGNLYIADTDNNRVRKVDTSGIITTVAGGGTSGLGDGGAATSAQLYTPEAIAVSSSGILYIADANNHRIRKVDTSGIISTVVGTGTAGFSGDGSIATAAELHDPQGVALDPSGNLFIADSWNHRIREVP